MSAHRLEITVSPEMYRRLDEVRGHEPRASFVKRALEQALSGSIGREAEATLGSTRPVPARASKDRGLMTPGEAQVVVDQAIAPPEVQARPVTPAKKKREREPAPEDYVIPKIAKRHWAP